MRGYWDSYPHLQRDLEKVRGIIEASLSTRNDQLSDALKKIVSRNGKMLRPAFVVLAARMKPFRGGAFPLKKDLSDKIYRIAAAVEILHMATLVHDDVIDLADKRRGEPSVNAEYGNRRAILLGDYLFSLCFSLVADDATMQNARFLARGVGAICASEISQSRRFDQSTLTVRDYLRRIVGKTAVLFSLSFHVGASENGLAPSLCTILRRVGYNIGMDFQVTDDLLDFLGDTKILGKPAGGDLREGIFTLPVIHAYLKDPKGLGRLLDAERLAVPETFEEVKARILKSGGFDRAREVADRYNRRAAGEAERLPATENRLVLLDVIGKLKNRQF